MSPRTGAHCFSPLQLTSTHEETTVTDPRETGVTAELLPLHCPACGHLVIDGQPVERLFTREEVCRLVPVLDTTLRRWLARHRGHPGISAPKYTGPANRARRMFSGQDILTLRAAMVRSYYRKSR